MTLLGRCVFLASAFLFTGCIKAGGGDDGSAGTASQNNSTGSSNGGSSSSGAVNNNSCSDADDGFCDDNTEYCVTGTDCEDCGNCGDPRDTDGEPSDEVPSGVCLMIFECVEHAFSESECNGMGQHRDVESCAEIDYRFYCDDSNSFYGNATACDTSCDGTCTEGGGGGGDVSVDPVPIPNDSEEPGGGNGSDALCASGLYGELRCYEHTPGSTGCHDGAIGRCPADWLGRCIQNQIDGTIRIDYHYDSNFAAELHVNEQSCIDDGDTWEWGTN